jgi:hypothetical protein
MLIGEIQKNSTDKLRVSVSEYKSFTFLDVRVYYENDHGEYKPTKKGITLKKEDIEPLIKLLQEGERRL